MCKNVENCPKKVDNVQIPEIIRFNFLSYGKELLKLGMLVSLRVVDALISLCLGLDCGFVSNGVCVL